jgi:hypothetical protein
VKAISAQKIYKMTRIASMTEPLLPWQAERPYNQLPLLPPGIEIETRAVLKKCIEVNRIATYLLSPSIMLKA